MISFALILALVASSTYGYPEGTAVPDQEFEWTDYSLTGRIVNGTKAHLRQFPYQVSLRRSYSGNHFCGGSLIKNNYVLTAAHCVVKNGRVLQPWTVLVVGGEVQLSKNSSTTQTSAVDKIIPHSLFVEDTLQNDIAIIILKVEFKLTQELNVVPLAFTDPVPNVFCQVAGWGYPSEDNQQVVDNLMYVDLPLLSTSKCEELLVNVTPMYPGMMCAGYEEGQKDACQGDSGGGMICNGILTGVVSGGNGCARPGNPGVYSNVYFFRDWIETNAGGNSKIDNTHIQFKVSGSVELKSTVLSSVLLSVFMRV